MSPSGRARYFFLDGIAVVEVVGEESLELLIDVHTRLARDPAFVPGMPKLLDDRRVTSFIGPMDMIKIRAVMAEANRGFAGRRKIGTVSGDPMAKNFVRLYQDVANIEPDKDQIELRIFSDFDQAVAWLKDTAST